MTDFIERKINLLEELKTKSIFLFGPRQTGKSSIIQKTLGKHKIYNLLKSDVFTALGHSPQQIREELTKNDKIIIIDEIQKLPNLLDEVHLMIEEYNIKFLLTGSSARKLKRKGVNLLAGRARSRSLHPFIQSELKKKFKLEKALQYGLIPSIYLSDEPWEDLKSYVGIYLQEEIAAEAIVRNIGAFSRFLEVAAICNCKMLNYTSIANDAQVPVNTVREYFQILKDTLIAHELPAFNKTIKRKPINTSKFYFFDIGVAHYLQKRKAVSPKTPEYGDAFESYIFHELKSFCDYNKIDDLHYWRSKSQFEVDFILDNKIAIEAKAKANISSSDLKGIKALKEENILRRYIIVYLGTVKKIIDGIELLPLQDFLDDVCTTKDPE